MADETTTATTTATAATTAPAASSTTTTQTPDNTTAATATTTTPAATTTTAEPATLGATEAPAEPPYWPDDWRIKLAGKDEALLKRLNRFGSPDGVFNSWRALERRVSSGDLKPEVPFPEEGTDDEKTAWRTERGVPPAPEGYLENLPNGLVIGEADKPLLDTFIKAMHEANAPPAHVHRTLDWYYRAQEQMLAARDLEDKAHRRDSDQTLYGKWGPNKTAHISHMHGLWDGIVDEKGTTVLPAAPSGLKERMYGARFSDGRLFGDDPDFISWAAQITQTLDPVGVLAAHASGRTVSIQDLKSEKAALQEKMKDTRTWAHNDAGRARYREILEIEERLEARAGR